MTTPAASVALELDRRKFIRGLILIGVLGLALRCVVVALASRALPFGDGFWYFIEARIIAEGRGYLAPGQFVFKGLNLATAEHPPLFPSLLAVTTFLTSGSVLALQLTTAFLSALGVIVMGLLGRAVAGARVGLVTALLAAVAPNIWGYNELLLSESLLVATVGLFLLSVYRYWDRPTMLRAVVMGAALALATYTRTEVVFLGAFVVVPVVFMRRDLEGRAPRLRALTAAGLVTLVLMAPWTIRNLTTFDDPVLFSNNQDSVVAGANCLSTYYGAGLGSWDIFCNTQHLPQHRDQSVVFSISRRRGISFAENHASRLPVVVGARIGRTWEVFRPFQGAGHDGRSSAVWIGSTVTFWLLVITGAFGAWRLRRERRLVWPLVAMVPFVTLMAAFTYGLVRLRMPLDVALLVLAAVAIERWFTQAVTKRANRRSQSAAPSPA
ncbi:MAG: glycosyltransferase family 39 protein [Acidimicrobiia bacterium]